MEDSEISKGNANILWHVAIKNIKIDKVTESCETQFVLNHICKNKRLPKQFFNILKAKDQEDYLSFTYKF